MRAFISLEKQPIQQGSAFRSGPSHRPTEDTL